MNIYVQFQNDLQSPLKVIVIITYITFCRCIKLYKTFLFRFRHTSNLFHLQRIQYNQYILVLLQRTNHMIFYGNSRKMQHIKLNAKIDLKNDDWFLKLF